MLLPQRLNHPMPENGMPIAGYDLSARLQCRGDGLDRPVLQEIRLRAGTYEDHHVPPTDPASMLSKSRKQNYNWAGWLRQIYLR